MRKYIRSHQRMLALLGCGVFSAAVLCVFYTGFIPVESGLGYDGKGYYTALVNWSQGQGIPRSPYMFMRMGSFLPHIVFTTFVSSNATAVVRFGQIWNALLMVGALVLMCDASFCWNRKCSCKLKWTSLFSGVLSMTLCWAFAVMPLFYPLLTDHTAIFVSALSLWAWSGGIDWWRRVILCCLVVYSCFVMPFLFVVPCCLLTWPCRSASKHTEVSKGWLKCMMVLISVLASLCPVLLLWRHMRSILSFSMANHDLCIRSLGAVLTLSILASFMFLLAYTTLRSVKRISGVGLLYTFIGLSSSITLIVKIPNWQSGMGGPDMIATLSKQAIQALLAQVVCHVACFGPLFLLGVAALLVSIYDYALVGPVIASLFFSVFLSVGTESRCYTGVLPCLAFLIAVKMNISVYKIVLLGIVSVLSLLFWWPYAPYMRLGLDNKCNSSQAYLCRVGPWMTSDSHEVFATVTIIALAVIACRDRSEVRRDNKANE